MSVPFNKLPGFNQLFLDYIENFDALREFFAFDYNKSDSFIEVAELKKRIYTKHETFDRSTITSILINQNKAFNSSEKTFLNLEKLKNENTFAIVTGQQLGLFTGYYYTIIKVLNAVTLCEYLNKQYSDYHFVPIFWMEGDDHDFLEVNHINIIDKDKKIKKIEYLPPQLSKEKNYTPVAEIEFDENINDTIENVFSSLRKTEFSENLRLLVEKSYKPGLNFKLSFGRFLNYLIGDYGLILLDPTDIEIKKLLIPIFLKELNTYPKSCEIVIDTTLNLEQNYEAQIKPKPINLFYKHNGKRHLIEPRQNKSFGLKNTKLKFSADELFNNLYEYPDNFSPNVVLRPICQDYLLPTVAYIAGPSEISYFAQLKGVYEFYNNSMPVIYPRASITLIEVAVNNFLLKNDLNFEDLFSETLVVQKSLRKLNSVNIDDIFNSFKEELNTITYEAAEKLRIIDKNLEPYFVNKVNKFIENLNVVKAKANEALIKNNQQTIDKLKEIISFIYPSNYLQERYFNILYYLNKYSLNLIHYLKENIDIHLKEHQLIMLIFKD